MNTRKWLLFLSPFLCLAAFHTLAAHDFNKSYSTITVKADTITLRLRLDEAEVPGFQDLDSMLSADDSWMIDAAEEIVNNLELVAAGERIRLTLVEANRQEDDTGNRFAVFLFVSPLESMIWKLRYSTGFLKDLPGRHRHFCRVASERNEQQYVFSRDDSTATFEFSGEGRSFRLHFNQFFALGVEHIFLGFDHILFLLALVITGGRFIELVKIVTSFTVAHSITLILAATDIASFPARAVESLIAASIAFIAIENMIVKQPGKRWLIAFVFGLVHGFGFSGVLSEIGLPRGAMAASLFSFNVGIEIGQTVIVAVLFPLILAIQKSRLRERLVLACSSALVVVSAYWFIERAFDVTIL